MYVVDKAKNWGVYSLTISIVAMFLSLIPALGYSLGIIGTFLAYKSMDAESKDAAVSGMILGIIAVLLSFARALVVYIYG